MNVPVGQTPELEASPISRALDELGGLTRRTGHLVRRGTPSAAVALLLVGAFALLGGSVLVLLLSAVSGDLAVLVIPPGLLALGAAVYAIPLAAYSLAARGKTSVADVLGLATARFLPLLLLCLMGAVLLSMFAAAVTVAASSLDACYRAYHWRLEQLGTLVVGVGGVCCSPVALVLWGRFFVLPAAILVGSPLHPGVLSAIQRAGPMAWNRPLSLLVATLVPPGLLAAGLIAPGLGVGHGVLDQPAVMELRILVTLLASVFASAALSVAACRTSRLESAP